MRSIVVALVLSILLFAPSAASQPSPPNPPTPGDLEDCMALSGDPPGNWEHDTSGPVGFHLYTPASVQPHPALLVFLHPALCGWRSVSSYVIGAADATGTIVLFAEAPETTFPVPETLAAHDGSRNWRDWNAGDQHRDAGVPKLIAEHVRDIMASHDARAAYVAGWSAGAGMAVLVAATYPDVFSGLGTVSGFEYAMAQSESGQQQALQAQGPDPRGRGQAAHDAAGAAARPIRVFFYHSEKDTDVPPVHAQELAIQWNTTNALAGAPAPGAMRERAGNVSGEPYRVRCWGAGDSAAAWWSVGHLIHYDFPDAAHQAPDIVLEMIQFLRDGKDGCAAPVSGVAPAASNSLPARAVPAPGAVVIVALAAAALGRRSPRSRSR